MRVGGGGDFDEGLEGGDGEAGAGWVVGVAFHALLSGLVEGEGRAGRRT